LVFSTLGQFSKIESFASLPLLRAPSLVLVGASKEAPLERSDFSFFAFAMGYLPVGAAQRQLSAN
jgi:hypothetical protein